MNKFWGHLRVVIKHRKLVRKYCFECGFYKRGLLHDLSKYSWTEFISSVKFFQGNRSPIAAEKEAIGYSLAWQYHKGHNKHHSEYWIDYTSEGPKAIKIPYEYVVEMICDWISAGIVYNKRKIKMDEPYEHPLKYFNAHLPERIFHPETQKLAIHFLELIANKGISSFCKAAKEHDEYVTNYLLENK